MAASAYEALLLAALLIAVGFALLPFVTPPQSHATATPPSLYVMSPASRALSGGAAIVATAAYCGWFWSQGRRTLAMKTWRLTLTAVTGGPLPLRRALGRYVFCFAGPALALAAWGALQPAHHARWAIGILAVNYAWALLDPQRRFLQDRLAGTRLVRAP